MLKDIISILLENGHKIVLIYFKETANDFFKFNKKYNNLIEIKNINYNLLSILNKRKYFNTKISFSSGIIADIINSFIPCMCSGLSYYLSLKYSPDTAQANKLIYEDELQRALTADGSRTSTHITPQTFYGDGV